MSIPRWWIGVVAVALALQMTLSGSTGPQQADEQAMPPTNAEITTAVQDAMTFDSSVPSHAITVRNDNGHITLMGTVDNLRVRDRAVRITQAVKGVEGVIDRMSVRPSDRSDREIREEVNNALLYDPAADSYEVDPVVVDGEVTLNGTVNSWQERQLAIEVAKGVRGVRDVRAMVTINHPDDRPDAEIRPEIEGVLERDVLVDASRITVEVDDGRVTLTGAAGSVAEVERAKADSWVTGVTAVDADGLKVESWHETPERRSPPVLRTDAEIKEAIEDAFLYDPRVYSFNPEVSVSGGVVTLSGTVDNLKAKQAAERDARNTVGVWRVKNYLTVRPSVAVSDMKITQQIETAMVFNPLVDSQDVSVTSQNGLVTLTGKVDSFVEKSEAEDVAMRTNGVVAVTNALDVANQSLTSYMWDYLPFYSPAPDMTSWPYRSDAEITDEIKDELFWSPFVDSDEVQVSVQNGVATLEGTVDSWFEFRSARENAVEGGALSVINNLDVR
jgi:osmotically-inducible protein OsmY